MARVGKRLKMWKARVEYIYRAPCNLGWAVAEATPSRWESRGHEAHATFPNGRRATDDVTSAFGMLHQSWPQGKGQVSVPARFRRRCQLQLKRITSPNSDGIGTPERPA